MSKLLANQIANYNDNGPVEVKEGVNIPTGKPLQVAGGSGTSGQFLKSTGSSVDWEDFPSIPAAQVNADWNATSGVAQISNKPTLATVAISGSYNDLLNQPTIPAGQVQVDWNENQTGSLRYILNKPTLFSGAYSDLTGKPTVPAVLNDLADVSIVSPNDGEYVQWNAAQTRWVTGTGSAGIQNVVEDTTPQLGGDLDANGFNIDMGGNNITDAKVGEWNAAYAWGNHAAQGYLTTYTDTTYSQACIGDSVGVKVRLAASSGVVDDILITAGTGITIDQIGTEGFRINSSGGGGGGGGATVTTSDAAPTTPSDGDLWWKSNEGRLKVYYDDGSGTQWVDASPPLSPSFTPKISNNTVSFEAKYNTLSQQHYLEQVGHILPATNATYDIGSAEKKVRHLFLSDNSIWLGEDVKMSRKAGKVKFYTRNRSKVPEAVASAGGSLSGCITFVNLQYPGRTGPVNSDTLLLNDWLHYFCDLTSAPVGTYGPEDLWPSETINDVANDNFNTDDWLDQIGLDQPGRAVAPQINDDASEYKLSEGVSFLRTSALADFPVKVVGAQLKDRTVVEITIYVPQGGTPRTISELSIDGSIAAQLKFTGTPEGNTTNTFTIKAIYFGSQWIATVAIG